MNNISEKEAYNKMAAYCSKGEHCSFEVLEKLRKMDLEQDSIHSIIKKLEKEKFIDNERYTKAYVNDKLRFSKWGRLKISQALYQKGIDRNVIKNSLDEIDKEEYSEILLRVIQAKKKDIRAKNEYEFNQKLIRSVLGRGFEMNEILKYIHLED